MKVNKYELLQTLEMIFPDRKDWFITEDEFEQDEGTFIQITVKIDKENEDGN